MITIVSFLRFRLLHATTSLTQNYGRDGSKGGSQGWPLPKVSKFPYGSVTTPKICWLHIVAHDQEKMFRSIKTKNLIYILGKEVGSNWPP